eukprot:SAG11_NODE_26726_length_341_cov_1.260331_1_plen_42_part_01
MHLSAAGQNLLRLRLPAAVFEPLLPSLSSLPAQRQLDFRRLP